jgi:hypothetical protein
MNTIKNYTTTLMLIASLFFSLQIIAQDNVLITTNRNLSGFTKIIVGGTLNVYLEQADEFSVEIEAAEKYQDRIITEVTGNTLTLKTKDIKNAKPLNAYIKLPELDYLKASGATDVKSRSLFESDNLEIIASGATSVSMDIVVHYLETEVSGAADLKVSGTAGTHILNVSGAADLDARGLVSEKAKYTVSGASDATLNVTGEIEGTKSGSADVTIIGSPTVSYTNTMSESHSYSYSKNYYDSVKVKVGKVEVEVFEGDDSIKVRIGNRVLHVDDDGNVEFRRTKKKKFNGHWAGFDMGLNGYVDPDYKMSFPPETEYLDLRTTKSWAVHVNFFEQNIALAKNQKWGMVTGLGINWNNYRFSKNTRLNSDSSQLIGYIDQDISIRKSKLTALYVNVPLVFEFQTNSYHKKESFHIGVGMVMNVRVSSHTKKYYNELNKEFDVARYNPITGQYETEFTTTSPGNSKAKDFNDFYLRPFKFDATVRIGWGFINLFATYSVNSMFKENKGPELYPWTVGITLVNL